MGNAICIAGPLRRRFLRILGRSAANIRPCLPDSPTPSAWGKREDLPLATMFTRIRRRLRLGVNLGLQSAFAALARPIDIAQSGQGQQQGLGAVATVALRT